MKRTVYCLSAHNLPHYSACFTLLTVIKNRDCFNSKSHDCWLFLHFGFSSSQSFQCWCCFSEEQLLISKLEMSLLSIQPVQRKCFHFICDVTVSGFNTHFVTMFMHQTCRYAI
jgi:hypothetical protein